MGGSEWLTTRKVADRLGMTPRHVRVLCRAGMLSAVKDKHGHWLIGKDEFAQFQDRVSPADFGKYKVTDTGFIEISVALTGVSSAILAIIPSVQDIPEDSKRMAVFIALIIGCLSFYASLWFLGEYLEDTGHFQVKRWEFHPWGIGHIWAVFANLTTGPYWLIAAAFTVLVIGIGIIGMRAL